MPEELNLAWLRQRLENDELSIYSAVVIARRDLAEGRVSDALSRLRSEADKIRMYDRELAAMLLPPTH